MATWLGRSQELSIVPQADWVRRCLTHRPRLRGGSRTLRGQARHTSHRVNLMLWNLSIRQPLSLDDGFHLILYIANVIRFPCTWKTQMGEYYWSGSYEKQCEVVAWVCLAHETVLWQAVVNTTTSLLVPYNAWKLLISRATSSLSRITLLHRWSRKPDRFCKSTYK
jgi:hypothetical protein